jgi:hypothetical protein
MITDLPPASSNTLLICEQLAAELGMRERQVDYWLKRRRLYGMYILCYSLTAASSPELVVIKEFPQK